MFRVAETRQNACAFPRFQTLWKFRGVGEQVSQVFEREEKPAISVPVTSLYEGTTSLVQLGARLYMHASYKSSYLQLIFA